MKEDEQNKCDPKSFFDDPMPIEDIHQSFGLIYVVKRFMKDIKSKRENKKSQEVKRRK
jgi:hypothetical protein